MKNLTKIFLAVAVAMFAFACVTDTTEDLGIEVGKGGVTEITVSLEESRTQLGEKADGKYPLYWSEGDAISINGVASNPLAAGGEANAVFSFNQEVARPYCVVYPATEGVGEGTVYPVTFAATQPYTEGTFALGVAPMYGYAAELAEGEVELPLQLNHLTGVLRFAIKGEATLSSIAITAEKPIAGAFTVDCANGTLTAGAEATNTVTVTFGEGLALGAEATPIYVAVPAGSHGLYTITINSTDGKAMVVKYDSDAKPVKVGIVKEFGEILYAPSEVTAPEGELVIVSESDMLRLQKWAADGKLTNVTKVTVGATIDMSVVADWQPIAGFPAIEFDGGSDKGYEIKGLTSPLFGTVTGATIKNVKLTGVNITETERLFSGSLVCEAYTSTITNCSLEGAYTYAYAYDLTENSGHTVQAAGGLIGLAKDTNVSGCTNYATIKGAQFWAKCSGKRYPTLGGVIGTATASAAPESKEAAYSVKNCTNYGSVTSAHDAKKLGGTLGVEMGGVLGRAYYVFVNNIVNGEQGTDKGAVTITAYANSPYWGGCIGWLLSCYADGVTNYAPVSFNCSIVWSCMGGVVGTLGTSSASWSLAENFTNYGTISCGTNTTSLSGIVTLGGIFGRSQSTAWTVNNCINYGDVIAQGDWSGVSNDSWGVGGVFAECNVKKATNCKNFGNISFTSTKKMKISLNVGGVAGVVNASGVVIENWQNGDPDAAPNSVTVNVAGNSANNYVGGVIGNNKNKGLKNCHNHGNVSYTGATDTNPYIGGIAGYSAVASTTIENCDNYNNTDTDDSHIAITVNSTSSQYVYVGGLFGSLGTSSAAISSIKDCTNNCAINVDATAIATTGQHCIGGLAGLLECSGTVTSCVNDVRGDIVVDGTYTCNTAVAGMAAHLDGKTVDCANNGDIDFKATIKLGTAEKGGTAYINGMYYTGGSDSDAHTNFTQSGNLTFSGIIDASCDAKNVYMSGVGYNMVSTLTNVKNTGTLKVSKEAVVDAEVQIGGIARDLRNATVVGCSNSGTIISEGKSVHARMGALSVVTSTSSAKFSGKGFTNTGNVIFAGQASGYVKIGGLWGDHTKAIAEVAEGAVVENKGTVSNYVTNADGSITVGKVGTYLMVGGVAGNIRVAEPAAVQSTGTVDVRYAEGCYKDGAYIGGIVGCNSLNDKFAAATYLLSNAKMTGKVAAIGFTESKTSPIVGVGMVVGTHRSTTAPQVSNCVIGGRLALEEIDGKPFYRSISQVEFLVDDADGNPEPNPNFIPYWAKIYGGTNEWELGSTYDGCTPDPSAPSEAPEA